MRFYINILTLFSSKWSKELYNKDNVLVISVHSTSLRFHVDYIIHTLLLCVEAHPLPRLVHHLSHLVRLPSTHV